MKRLATAFAISQVDAFELAVESPLAQRPLLETASPWEQSDAEEGKSVACGDAHLIVRSNGNGSGQANAPVLNELHDTPDASKGRPDAFPIKAVLEVFSSAWAVPGSGASQSF